MKTNFSQNFFMDSIAVLVALSVLSSLTAAQSCSVSLPQYVASNSSCAVRRQRDLALNQATYRLNSQDPDNPFALVDLTPSELAEIIKKDPFMRPYALQYRLLIDGITGVFRGYVNRTKSQRISSMEDYAKIRQYFRVTVTELFGEFVRLPSDYEPFQNNLTSWIDDEFFSQQRLAGINPMSLQMVSIHVNGKGCGLDWTKLKKDLNPDFDWECAVQEAVGVYMSLKEAILTGHVYVLRHYLCDDLPQQIDITDFDLNRKMKKSLSPIALFVASSDAPGGLKPVAIQVDYKPDSPVYTPKDGADWMFAKLNVQTTDLGYSQIVEHLVECHFVTEALCVAMKRHFSSQHPVHQIMKFHCREVLVPNVFGGPTLLSDNGFMRMLFAMGNQGTSRLIRDSYDITGWDVTDFRENLKKRGMSNKKRIPYYPYRDDGETVYTAIEQFVEEYVNHYYKHYDDVKDDTELQGFANEVSAEGTVKPDGGNGKLKGFPTKVTCAAELQEILTRWIWQLVGQHSTVSYELSDYGSFVPNMPTKTYTDKRVAEGQFDYHTFPNRFTAALQSAFTMKLSSFRFDRLFDYGFLLDDKVAGDIVNRHFWRLASEVEKRLVKRNNKRKAAGRLTYPFLQPRWLPNGIQT